MQRMRRCTSAGISINVECTVKKRSIATAYRGKNIPRHLATLKQNRVYRYLLPPALWNVRIHHKDAEYARLIPITWRPKSHSQISSNPSLPNAFMGNTGERN
jgi:hypothetical protein